MQLRYRRMDSSFAGWAVRLLIVSLLIAVTGYRPAAPGGRGAPAPAPQAEEPDAPKGDAVADGWRSLALTARAWANKA
jgi:hypothetical protein